MIELLIRNGADVNHREEYESIPLQFAAFQGNYLCQPLIHRYRVLNGIYLYIQNMKIK